MRRAIRFLVFFLVVGGLAFLLSRFFEENSEPFQVQLMGFRTKPMGTGIFIALLFFSGVLLSFVAMIGGFISQSVEVARLKRENAALQKLLESKTHSSSSNT